MIFFLFVFYFLTHTNQYTNICQERHQSSRKTIVSTLQQFVNELEKTICQKKENQKLSDGIKEYTEALKKAEAEEQPIDIENLE